MKVSSAGRGTPVPKGVDLHVVDSEHPVVRFAAYVLGSTISPGGEMKLHLGVPFDQVPLAVPLMQHTGGIQFEVTVRRVPVDELPEAGW